MKNFKPVLISFAAMILVLLASCNSLPSAPEDAQISSGTVVETKSGKQIYIRHAGPFGPRFHLIDVDRYYEIMDIIISQGGDPSPENIDRINHALGG
jgi:hypothetical protein